VVRTGGSGPAAAAAGSGVSGSAVMELGPAAGAAVDVWGLLRLALNAMEPPDQPGQQVGLVPDQHRKTECKLGVKTQRM